MVTCKYIALSVELEKYIREKGLHGRLPGTAKLAEIFQVNHITLRKAIKLLVDKNKLSVIPNEGTFIVENKKERKKYHGLGFVGFPSEPEFADELFEELNDSLAAGAYRAINIAGNPALFAERPELLLEFPVDGFVFFGSNITRNIAVRLLEEKIPAICTINRNFPEFSHVGMDHMAAYSKAIELLQERNCRKIAFLGFQRKTEFQNYIEDIRWIFQEKLKEDFDEDLFLVYDLFAYKEKFWSKGRKMTVEDALAKWQDKMPQAVITNEYSVPFFKEKRKDLAVLEFASGRLPDYSLADITFMEDTRKLLHESTRLLLAQLEGDQRKKVVKIPFQIKIST